MKILNWYVFFQHPVVSFDSTYHEPLTFESQICKII